MPSPQIPPEDPKSAEIAKQKMALTIALLAISVSAICALFVLRRFPLPVRLFLITGDVIVMLALWMIVRQKFSGK